MPLPDAVVEWAGLEGGGHLSLAMADAPDAVVRAQYYRHRSRETSLARVAISHHTIYSLLKSAWEKLFNDFRPNKLDGF